MLRHWILAAAFVIGTIMCICNLLKKSTPDKSADYKELYREYNTLLLILFAALAYEQISDLLTQA